MKTQTKQLTLILDQGSHASRIAVFADDGTLLQSASQNIITQNDGVQYEQDANAILASFHSLFQQINPEYIPFIINCGICTQRSSIVAWHKTGGQPLSPVISWRDLRSQGFIESLDFGDQRIKKITGLPLSAHYSAGKMHWLLTHDDAVAQAMQNRQLCLAPLASFLLFHLLQDQPFVIDHSNAQRTQLFDIERLKWSDELLSLFQINVNCLPQLKPVIHQYGLLSALNIPVTCVCGDQNAALHAYPQLNNNEALVNIGTGAFILSTAREKQGSNQLLRSIAKSQHNTADYITEGTVNGAGAALSWAQKKMPEKNLFNHLPQWLNEVKSPPLFINTVAGIGSPWWCSAGEPKFIPNKKMHTNAQQYVAIIESIAFLIFNNLQQFEQPAEAILVSGGLSQLDGLCQKLADLCNAKVLRYKECESSARGCAWLSKQILKNNPIWHHLPVEKTFSPVKNVPLFDRYQQFVGEIEKYCNSN